VLERGPRAADTGLVLSRLRGDAGFGLVELLIAMVLLNIGLLAIATAIVSGTTTVRRSSRHATASALADAQMELYRALTYSSIALDSTSVSATDTTYRNDSALSGSISNDITTTSGCTGLPNQCVPSRTVTGPDHGTYRVDTYIVSSTPTSGRALKLVTVVVRDSSNLSGNPYVRIASTFDLSTAS
jgi:type II secretory pathway pseudopilin PulG